MPLDRGSHWIRQHQPRWPHRAGPGLRHRIIPTLRDIQTADPRLRPAIRRRLQIEACTECAARPGQHRHLHRLIRVERQKHIIQRLRRRRMIQER